MLKILRAKFHGIRVTASDLDYHGSITLDPEQCALAGICPLEFVEIWNKNSGQRLSTYVIYGEPGSRCCVLNGAAARTCQKGDELIICAVEYVADARELATRRPGGHDIRRAPGTLTRSWPRGDSLPLCAHVSPLRFSAGVPFSAPAPGAIEGTRGGPGHGPPRC